MGSVIAVRALLRFLWATLHSLVLRVRALLFPAPAMSETKSIERGLGVLNVLWGAVLLLPSHTFATSQALTWLYQNTDENMVGIVFIGIGIVKLVSVQWGNLLARAAASALGCLAWLAVVVSVAVSVEASTAWVVYGWLAWLSSYDYMELLARYLHQRAVHSILNSWIDDSVRTTLPVRKVKERSR